MSAVPAALTHIAANAELEEGLTPLPADHDQLVGGLMGGKAKLWGPDGRPDKLDAEVPPIDELRGGRRLYNAVMRNAMGLRRIPNSLDGDKCLREDFSEFFSLLRAPLSPVVETAIMQEPSVRAIASFVQGRMMASERRIERAWAEQLLAERKLTMQTLRNYWYYANYNGLCDNELDLLHRGEPGLSLTYERDRIAMVGGGSLPLTAIMLHDMAGVPVTVVDYNPRCCQIARKMVRELGVDKHIDIVQADGRAFDYKGHSIVIIAANMTGLRETVAQALTTSHPQRVMLRSVDGLRALMYKPATYDDIRGYGLQHVGQADRSEEYYNSSQCLIPPFGLIGEMGHDLKLDTRFSRYMPNMHMGKNFFLVSMNAQ
ncbi:MAG: hypothetical protein KI792_13560 [Alphaproteobacteria bacterium]|nr:hypothetical protein [Alphaproteobacteria bacterium SS10]